MFPGNSASACSQSGSFCRALPLLHYPQCILSAEGLSHSQNTGRRNTAGQNNAGHYCMITPRAHTLNVISAAFIYRKHTQERNFLSSTIMRCSAKTHGYASFFYYSTFMSACLLYLNGSYSADTELLGSMQFIMGY